MANILPFRRKRRHRLPPDWTPYLQHPHWPPAQLRMTAWAGMLLGLLAWQAMRLVPPPEPSVAAAPAAEAPDPYAEARRSRAILEAQEGAPSSAPDVRQGVPAASGAATSLEADVVSAAVRVVDGDTFAYRGARVRIADIDAPEVHGRCAYETALAARATQRMRALLAAGPFELHPFADGRDEDRYGRKLRIVTRAGRSLGDVLVAEGLARTWTGRREPWCV
jgi:endonuclease YncB( thermonuclease family)